MKRASEQQAGGDDKRHEPTAGERAPSGAASSMAPTAFLVAVGSGGYMVLRPPAGQGNEHYMAMEKGTLLRAVREDDLFSDQMKGVSLSVCAVWAVVSAADDEPSAADLTRAKELKGATTLTSLLHGLAGNVFVRIQGVAQHAAGHAAGPAGQAAGTSPYDATLGIPVDVWGAMCPAAQAAAKAAGQHRALLAGLPVLQQLQAVVPPTAAQAMGVQAIRSDAAGNVAVGAFMVPQLRRDITMPPKTFDSMSTSSSDVASTDQLMLLLPQRMKCACEFLDAVVHRKQGFGVLLSGPNGVGKSGIGLLCYLICIARRVPVVYMSRCQDWVKAASSKAGGGDEFFLETLWRQNADVIAATPALRTVFAAALRGDGTPFTADMMHALQLAVAAPDGPQVGVIMDEVQHITKVVAAADLPDAPQEVQRAGRYFATSWHDWTNSNSVFPRVSIASAHGQKDVKLPDGEAHRLRIIEPLDPEDTAALQRHPSSTAFVFSPPARASIVFMAGNILRKLVQAASQLPLDRAPSKAQLQAARADLWASMVEDCSKWLQSLPPTHADACARQVKALLRGELSWSTAKPLYDAGIVYRTMASPLVHPVSAMASAVILHVMAAHVCALFKDIKSIQDGRLRGFEFEDQVFSFLNPVNQLMPCKLLDGSPGPALPLRCDYSLPFKELKEVVPRDVPVLYRPLSSTYPCDGIVMPQAEDEGGSPSGEIILVECSTDKPRLAVRIDKVRKWYLPEQPSEADRVATVLKARYPARPLVVALCYDKELDASRKDMSAAGIALSNGMAAADASGHGDAASSAPTGTIGSTVRVLDCLTLRQLGLVL